MQMNFEKIKKEFPIFEYNKDLIYFDNAATYQKPNQVIDVMSTFYKTSNSNVHRSFHRLGRIVTQQYEQTREKVRDFINARLKEEIVFIYGTTAGINFIANSWARENLKPGDEIVTTIAEHHANFLPWQAVAQQTGAVVKLIYYNKETGLLEYDDSLINKKTKLVAVTQASNVVGEVWADGQLERLIQQAHNVGAKVLVDAAQSIIHHKVDVQKLDPDFLVFSGHKMMGPTGVGVVYIKHKLYREFERIKHSDSIVAGVSLSSALCLLPPKRFEAGTPPIAEVIGLGSAIDYIQKEIDFNKLREHETMLCNQILDGFSHIPGICLAGNEERLRNHGYVISFTINEISSVELAEHLGAEDIAFRTGNHCAIPFVNYLGSEQFLRVSLGVYNSCKDVQIFLDKLDKAVNIFAKK